MNLYYEIKQEGDKFNVYYYGGDYAGLKEFYAYNLSEPQTLIRYGYKELK